MQKNKSINSLFVLIEAVMGENEIVLITGGSGFLGQHIVRQLQKTGGLNVTEIRIIDLKPYCNTLSCPNFSIIVDYKEILPIKSYIKDINEDVLSFEEAFNGVTCVIHCAALISYEFPTNTQALWKNNVKGTSNIISLCKEYDVSKLIFTSTAEVSYVPYFGSMCISILINQTEIRAVPNERKITEYAASKLVAEQIVLNANESKTKNGITLKTISLRPVFIYGEGDNGMMTSLLKVSNWFGGVIPRIAGTGGKQQIVYAGNVAWSHICAMKTLQQEESHNEENGTMSISGLPVFVTDNTSIADTTRLCEKLLKSEDDGEPLIKQSWWTIPILVSMLLAICVEFISKTLLLRLPIAPRSLICYIGSLIFFNTLRASTGLHYSPIYGEEECLVLSSKYYRRIYECIEKEKYFENTI